jgi:FK506-binding nuclear protein
MRYPDFEDDSEDEEDEEEEEEEDEEDEDDIKLPKVVTREAVIAVLKPGATEQVSINLSIVEDVEAVEFVNSGPNKVHLVGHYIRQEDFDQDPYSDEDSDDDEFDSDDESIDSDEMEGLSGLIGEGEDEDDDEEEERFEELKDDKKKSKKRAAEEDADVASLLTKPADAEDADADISMSSTLSKNQKKKLAKKLKSADGSAAPAPVAAAPTPAAAAPAPAAAKKAAASGPETRTLAGGLQVTDAKKGDGPVAKNGKKVGMRYIGKLANGKVFDSNTKGSPLVFTLGRGEVIKGWDIGVAGMAVGGERKLVIPAALAYGKKGTQGIPGNSVLHFDVKLVSVK